MTGRALFVESFLKACEGHGIQEGFEVAESFGSICLTYRRSTEALHIVVDESAASGKRGDLLCGVLRAGSTAVYVQDMPDDFERDWFVIAGTPEALAMDVACWVVDQPKPVMFRHYKGGYYKLLARAKGEKDGQDLAVYSKMPTGEVFSRPWSEFFGRVYEDDPDSSARRGYRRFEPVYD